MNFIKKNIEHLGNFLDYIIEHILCIMVLILVFIIGLGILKLFPYSMPKEVQSQEIYILGFSLNNLSIWFTAIGLIITAFWSMYQFTKNKILKQQERASEIAQDFANNLIEKMGIISDVLLANQEFKKMITRIVKSRELNQFTALEISEILKDDKCFQKCNKIIHSKRTQKRYSEILSKRYNSFERNRFESYFPLLVENTLNHLEAICINISSQAAGSQFIYNSLHQSFLNTVEVLSIKISNNNNNNIDKYFINIIQVYNMWNYQRQKDIDKFKKTENRIKKLENKANKEIYNLLNKKNETV